jgi:site-specific recombinase XerD
MKVKFFTRPSTKKIKPQEVPIYVRLRDDVIDLWQKTGIMVAPDQWDQKREDLKERIVISKEDRAKFSDNLHELRKYIRECYDKDVAKNIIGKQWFLTVITNFNKQKNAPPPKEKSIVFEKLFTRFLKEHRLADTRKRQMLVVMRAVMRFELYKQKSGNKSFRFNVKTLTNATMKEFWNFLKNEHKISKDYPEIYKEVKDCQSVISQRSNNTLVGFIKRLKVFFSWCIEEGVISESPLAGFEMPTEKYGTPIYITKEELHTIYNCDLSEAPHLDRQRDIFVFQCCIGCRVGDLVRLTKADVINGAIEYIASKTIEENQKTILVPLNKTALAILEKYKDYEGPKLLPFITQPKYNDAIKEIFTRAGITRNVTYLNPLTEREEKVPISTIASSHMARRTFVGNLYKQVLDPNIVASMSGHAEGSRAFSRYREIDREIKTNAVNLLD